MASISKEPNGWRAVQFAAADGKRRSIRLGKVSQRAAEVVRGHVEAIAAAVKVGHSLARETALWLESIDAELHGRLAAVGLVRRRETVTLAAMLEQFIASRPEAKPATKVVWGRWPETWCGTLATTGTCGRLRGLMP